MSALLAADSIGRVFNRTRVLTSATLWGRPGEITALLGRNGSGKTTLLRVAAGRLAPSWGAVRLGDEVSERPRLHRLARRGLFYVAQEGLLPRGRTVREVASLVARAFPDPADPDVDARVEAWAEGWDLTHLLDAVREELSGGERNRASVALAVLRRPACLLTDEPLTGSAPMDRERIVAGLKRMRDDGCAIVITGHEARELLAFADRVVWIAAGTTRDLGTPAEALASHQFRREYLGPGFRPDEPATGRDEPAASPSAGR